MFSIIHGDIKSGGTDCSKDLIEQRRNDFLSMHPNRIFYTPGDNEWTDCDRNGLKNPASELATLDMVRSIFFDTPLKLPKNWQYEQQQDYPENARWFVNDVYFINIHVVSTNNGRIEILMDNPQIALDMVDARDKANLDWLQKSVKKAKDLSAKAIVIASQADLERSPFKVECTPKLRDKCDAFFVYREELKKQAKLSRQPMLYLHGDTNPYCMDNNYLGAKNLWRLNSWGDFLEPADIVEININLKNSKSPFSAKTLYTKKEPKSGC